MAKAPKYIPAAPPARRSPARKALRLFLWLLLIALLLLAFLPLSRCFAHRKAPFTPGYPRQDLTALFAQKTLTEDDYHTLLLQTGLGRPAIDAYRAMGDAGAARLLQTQDAFFAPAAVQCGHMGFFTYEDHRTDGEAYLVPFPVAPLEPGDILLSFSTHTVGWRHGHAALVVDTSTPNGTVLEAALIGKDSNLADATHWSYYSTFLHLRLKDITPQQQEAIATYALTQLNGVPYHLTSGVFGRTKAPPPDSDGFGAQCAYLVWYALQAAGFDTDGDGGRIVTVADLAQSPLFEVVQVCGMDPEDTP